MFELYTNSLWGKKKKNCKLTKKKSKLSQHPRPLYFYFFDNEPVSNLYGHIRIKGKAKF